MTDMDCWFIKSDVHTGQGRKKHWSKCTIAQRVVTVIFAGTEVC